MVNLAMGMRASDTVREGFEPRIIGFLCNWCSYAGADLAGTSRLAYPANLRVIRVMCSGRVDPEMMIEPFLRGADGVMVLGCHIGDCHYLTGNCQAEQRVSAVWKVLDHLGVDRRRLFLDWVSAAEGERFAEMVEGFVESVKALGPAGGGPASKEGLSQEELGFRCEVAQRVVSGERFRWLVGRIKALSEEGNAYRARVSPEKAGALMQSVVAEECLRAAIEALAGKAPVSVRDIASRLGISTHLVLEQTAYLKRRGTIEQYDVLGRSPRYVLAGART
ncbi:MAG: hydrogenase iron-sulfur subunit [Firmicutes bacterium]|nr:hydrogenase iron-sulfur subunit [Bacillota bacterium]MDH7494629.1 hydrogenase iron-sulfur subunit [Bacillota bacterium]